jgi:hypothetical protein
MSTSDLRELARIKLTELRRQRRILGARYDELETVALRHDQPILERLDALLAGLGSMRFAQTLLHPAVAQIQDEIGVLHEEATAGRGDEELLQRALHRLHRELAQGRTRVEIAQLFGELIEEHLALPAAVDLPVDEAILAVISGPAPATAAGPWFERLLASRPEACAALCERLSEQKTPLVRIPDSEIVRERLQGIVTGLLQAQARREAASGVLASPTTLGEYTDVLRILIERLEEWEWPAGGVNLHVEWDHGKCRVSLDEPLVDALLLEHVGAELSALVADWRSGVGGSTHGHPEGALFAPADPPAGGSSRDLATMRRYFREISRFHLDQRLIESSNQLACASLKTGQPGYGSGATNLDKETHQEQLFAALHSQIAARRALAPDEPLWVLRFDLENFFPSVPHAAVIEALGVLGLAPRWRSLIARSLAVPGRLGGREVPISRGIFAGRALGWVLAELLLLPLETAIHEATGLRLIRLVDDVFVIASTREQAEQVWTITQHFVRDLGLALNEGKSGLVCLGPAPATPPPPAASPATGAPLPSAPPRWGALQLEADGQWRLDATKLESMRAWTASQIRGARSVLEAISRGNSEVLYLLRSLALTAPLPPSHLDAMAPHVARFHQDLFQPGHGVREDLLRRVQTDLRSSGGREALPSYLLHWPITAGGLGVLHPLIFVRALREARAARRPPLPPQERTEALYGEILEQFAQQEAERAATRRDEPDPEQVIGRWREHLRTLDFKEWGWPRHLDACAGRLALANPTSTPALEALVADFIDRGTEVSGRQQPGLSPYWRRVLHTYGPALLDAVGSFRFLLTELVPVPLLGRRGSSPGGEASDQG